MERQEVKGKPDTKFGGWVGGLMRLNEEILKKRLAGTQQMTQSLVLESKKYSEVQAKWGISLTIYGHFMVELLSLALIHCTASEEFSVFL